MPPEPIIPLASLQPDKLIAGRERIEAVNPHRYEFRLLDGVFLMDVEQRVFAGYHDVHADEYWVRGHIPGRPLFPGVLQIETAAQLASYAHRAIYGQEGFMGFLGTDEVKFRGTVQPPSRFIVIGRDLGSKPRRMTCYTQGFVDGRMVFEGKIIGMMV